MAKRHTAAAAACLLLAGCLVWAGRKRTVTYLPDESAFPNAQIGYAPGVLDSGTEGATLRYLGERHIQDCIRVVEQSQLDIPSRIRHTADLVQRSETQARSWQRADSTDAADESEKPSRNWQKRMRSPWQNNNQQ